MDAPGFGDALEAVDGLLRAHQTGDKRKQLVRVQELVQLSGAAAAGKAWAQAAAAAAQAAAAVDACAMPGLATQVLLMQAAAARQLHDDEQALQALDLALQLQPDCAAGLLQRSELHAAAGRHTARFIDLRRLSSLQPELPGILQALQQASRLCAEERRAAVRAAPPPRKTYVRSSRRAAPAPAAPGEQQPKQPQSQQQVAEFRLLGLAPGASSDEVRRAFKALAVRLHPDKVLPTASDAERAAAEERFKDVLQARDRCLSAPWCLSAP